MNTISVKTAISEAKRFVDTAEKALAECHDRDSFHMPQSKHNAAAKRASVDLSRALSEMRKP